MTLSPISLDGWHRAATLEQRHAAHDATSLSALGSGRKHSILIVNIEYRDRLIPIELQTRILATVKIPIRIIYFLQILYSIGTNANDVRPVTHCGARSGIL